MNVLITAGNTMTLIDKVRAITNVFSGKTGTQIALEAHRRGHQVTLLTSHPEVVQQLSSESDTLTERWALYRYRTFEDLQKEMQQLITPGNFDVIIHSAAVSDYQAVGVYAPGEDTSFDPQSGQWQASDNRPTMEDRKAGKVKSNEDELWIRLTRTPKLVDLIRSEWAYQGLLVKFKLEVGINDEELLNIAERSRQHSKADLMVANTLESATHTAFIGPLNDEYEKVSRRELASRLLTIVEQRQGASNDG